MNERINKKKVMYHFLNHVTEIVLILVVIALWISTDSFMKLNNWMNLLRSGAIKGLIALGVTMVLICGKIDLSTGSQVGLSGMFVAVFCKNMVAAGYNQTLACLIGMAVGIAFAVVIGLLHAFLQNTYDLPPFVVTLGTQYLMFGLAAIICNNYPIPNAYPNWYVQVGMGRLFGVVPYPVIIFFVAAVLCYFIMEQHHHRTQRLRRGRQSGSGPPDRYQCVQVQGVCVHCRADPCGDRGLHQLRAGQSGGLVVWQGVADGLPVHGDHRRHLHGGRLRHHLRYRGGRCPDLRADQRHDHPELEHLPAVHRPRRDSDRLSGADGLPG